MKSKLNCISLESYHVSSLPGKGLINTCSIPICLTCRWDYDAKRAEARSGEANLERSDENGKCLSKNPIIQCTFFSPPITPPISSDKK